MTLNLRFAGIELGGTKTIASLTRNDIIHEQVTTPTGDPGETLEWVRSVLAKWDADTPLSAVGIASFGPLQLKAGSANYGHILATPKPGWSGVDVAGGIARDLTCPWSIDTDVNGAALAEHRWGAGIGHDCLWYITIGTGLGGGLLIDGKPVHGAMHPEIGHIRIRRDPDDTFAGCCPFHGDCIEGLVSGPALEARFGVPASQLADDDPCWTSVAADLAELMGILLLTTAAPVVLLGGSIAIKRPFLLPKIRRLTLGRLSDYLPAIQPQSIDTVIRLAALGADAGPRGAIALAQQALAAK